ncbi:MAG TPA: hypothetical protein ENJ46_00035 [Hellea balneolensis]|uniref:Lipoprotein n=1 Tax=Hellea balneolensis TaxID=287478 RepID=A0A7C3C0D4_9PROT|nr:hypothetical protein [Hellea balneolensis]
MQNFGKHTILLGFAALSACASTPEVEQVEVKVPTIVQTCTPIAVLQKVVIPAETKSGFYITSIESPAEYYTDPKTGKRVEITPPPIESKVPYTKVIKEEEIYYTTKEGVRVDDICELHNEGEAPSESAQAEPQE